MPIPPAMRGSAPHGGLATRPVSRRAFVRAAAIGSALAGSGAAGVFEPLPAGAAGSLIATGADMHLLRRATHGPTQASARQLRRLGRTRWLDQQLHPTTIGDAFCEDYVADRDPDLDMTIRRAFRALEGRGT